MKAMVLHEIKKPLELTDVPKPYPSEGQVLIKISVCGVCRTDLHIVDGELPSPNLPLIPGHQIVGIVEELGHGVRDVSVGDRVGVPWVAKTCGQCHYCLSDRENLCDYLLCTGYQVNGGFAEYCVANAQFVFLLPPTYSDVDAAPLLCAGLIGYRSLRMAKDARRLGLYGFGASAHLMIQAALHLGIEVYVFTRKGDEQAQALAYELGALWAGDSEAPSPEKLDAAIIFAPVGALVPKALADTSKGGTVICAGIHMSDIPSFPYSLLWEERTIRSVANLTRQDGIDFLKIASKRHLKVVAHVYPLEKANEALDDLRSGRFTGSAVLKIISNAL